MEENNLLYIIKIEEKVGEIPADKIDKVVSAKDEINVNDNKEERLSQIGKTFMERLIRES